MRVERDLAGITIPFVIGVGVTILSWHATNTLPGHTAALPAAIIIAATAYLLHPCHHSSPPFRLRFIIGFYMTSCGILCGISAHVLSTDLPLTYILSGHFTKWGGLTNEVIDTISFNNPDTNAIIKALITGDRSDIPKHITKAFRESGASHILALSGLHLGIIYGILNKSLSIIGNSPCAQNIRSSATILVCGLYTLATGAGASIVRAFVFILTGETAKIYKRFKNTGTVLMTSLLIHLVIDPHALQEVGFQLSYAAMAGIAFIFPWLRAFWPQRDKIRERRGPLEWIWETAALSISCQITTGPLAYLYFGTFPIHFLLTNLIALPLVGIIIPAAVFSIILSASGICPVILLRATEALVTALTEALDIIASM